MWMRIVIASVCIMLTVSVIAFNSSTASDKNEVKSEVAQEIDRCLKCSALLLGLSRVLESSGYPNNYEIADMQKKSIFYLKKAEGLAGVELRDKLFVYHQAELERAKNMTKTDGFEAYVLNMQKRKNDCGVYSAK